MTMIWDAVALLAYCGLIFFLSSQSTLPTPMLFSNQDKLIHASAYAVMAALAWLAFRHAAMKPVMLAVACVLFSSLYGVSDEFHQSFVPGRDADVWDWLADTTGASLMVSALYRWNKSRATA